MFLVPALTATDLGERVTVVAGLDATKKLASAALVAVTMQVPADVKVRVLSVTEHPVAVPFETE
jgi:hypothetical protein